MATLNPLRSQWHPGEQAVQRILGAPSHLNPTFPGLTQAHAYRAMVSPLVTFGALDEQGRPWATVWGGEKGFCRPIAENVLGVNGSADARFDPVLQALFAVGSTSGDDGSSRGIVDGEVVKPEEGKVMAALAIDLETRDRVKLAGRFLAGAATGTTHGVMNLQMAFKVEEALGNCPKYLNKKRVVPHVPTPELVGSGVLPLPREAIDLIAKADLFFIASKHGQGESMDVNHRGGAPGFLRVFGNEQREKDGEEEEGGVVLVYPEYSGNRLYQTLGNLREDPVAGLVVPDFETGDVLYLTGRTTILVAEQAARYMPHAKLAVRVDVVEARFVKDGLSFRGSVIDYSPYNPPVRKLRAEKGDGEDDVSTAAIATATLLKRQVITPTITRYVFKVTATTTTPTTTTEGKSLWLPGQHVTFDFAPEMDRGWSHMRENDPQSLNDDFVRTFTVSSAAPQTGEEVELEIVAKRNGPATALLSRWNLRVPLEIPVLGFGGSEAFRMRVDGDGVNVFVAGGVGITPLLAQAAGLLLGDVKKGRLMVLWSLRRVDLALALDVFGKIDGLACVTRLFATGPAGDGTATATAMDEVKELGVEVLERRMGRDDVLGAGGEGGKKRSFFCCTGSVFMKSVLEWLDGEDVVFESFDY